MGTKFLDYWYETKRSIIWALWSILKLVIFEKFGLEICIFFYFAQKIKTQISKKYKNINCRAY